MGSSFLSGVSEKGARHLVHLYDTLTVDNRNTMGEHSALVPWREKNYTKGRYAVHPDKTLEQADTIAFDCIDVPCSSTFSKQCWTHVFFFSPSLRDPC